MVEDFENRNLSLIGHYQNSEEELDGIRKSHQITVNNYDRQLQLLKDHLTVIQTTLDRSVDRAEELELCCKMFSSFEEASNQDDILTQFDTKIKKGMEAKVPGRRNGSRYLIRLDRAVSGRGRPKSTHYWSYRTLSVIL